MSSLHHDPLIAGGSEPVPGEGTAVSTARGASRVTLGSPKGKATGTVPTQRQGKARGTGTDQPTATTAGSIVPAAKDAGRTEAASRSATRGARARAATVKAATVKAATVKAVTVKAATSKVATAARTAAVTTVANRTAGVRSARAEAAAATKASSTRASSTKASSTRPAGQTAAAAKTPAAKAPAAKAPAPEAPATTSAKSNAPAVEPPSAHEATAGVATVRPTPHKRVPVAADRGTAAVVVVRNDVRAAGAPDPDVDGRPSFLRRRPPVLGRRPALCVTAAVAAAIALGAFTAEEPAAQATATQSSPVSVAEQLGIEAGATDVLAEDATARLGELAVSRNARDAEQAAAMQVQMEADRIAAEAAAEAARPKAVLPVQGARLTSSFGPRWGTLHAGVDLAAPMHTPEYAAMDGVVLEAGPASGFGLAVYIQHGNGDVTVYGHMDKILVQPGQVVRAGDTIALLGNRGQSTGPHLHFEVHVGGLGGRPVDPLSWLRDKGVAI